MKRGTGQVALSVAVLCALITAVSAYAVDVTIKSLLVRVVTSAIVAGTLVMISGLWLHIKLLQRIDDVNRSITAGHTVDIEVSDNIPGEFTLQPLHAEQISEEDTRVIPARK